MDAFWIELDTSLPESLADYPSSIARDSIAAALHQVNVSLTAVTPEEAIILVQTEPRVLLFSATTPEWQRAVQVASQLRDLSPQSVLVVGGHHVSALPQGYGTQIFDYVIVGEGEEILQEIISDLSRRRMGLRNESRPQVLIAERITSLDGLPTPLRNINEVRRCRLRGLMSPSPSQQTGTAALLLSRGCNSRCTFCASHIVWGSELITRSAESAALEVRRLVDETGCNAMVFVDQAFGEDTKWAKELCSRLQVLGTSLHAKWYCMAKTSLNRMLLEDMASAGCRKIGFGIETANPERRKAVKHCENCDIENLNCLFRLCNKLGILVKVYFIIGFPWETPEYLLETTRAYLENMEANELKISYFTPFPETEDWSIYKDQLITSDWADFDTVKMPIVYNPGISVGEYHEIRTALFRSFYGSKTYAKVTRQMIGAYPHYIDSYREFADYLFHFGMVSEDAPWLEWIRCGLGSNASVAVG